MDVRDGAGVAWLPHSLVAQDLEVGVLCQTGKSDWQVKMDIRLVRNKASTNELTRNIRAFLARRQTVSLVKGRIINSVTTHYALPPLAVSINTRSPAARLIPLAN